MFACTLAPAPAAPLRSQIVVALVGGSGRAMPYTLRPDDADPGRWLLRTIVLPDSGSGGVSDDCAVSVTTKAGAHIVGSPATIRAVRFVDGCSGACTVA